MTLGFEPLASNPLASAPQTIAGITGALAAIESGADGFTATGKVVVNGSFASNETGLDAFAATGSVLSSITGTLAATETGQDTFSSTSALKVGGGYYDEPRKRKYVVKVGDKLAVFTREADAKRALDLQDQPKKAEKVAKKAAEVVPVATVANFVEKQRIDYLLIQKQLDQLLYEYEIARDEQDLEDILALL